MNEEKNDIGPMRMLVLVTAWSAAICAVVAMTACALFQA